MGKLVHILLLATAVAAFGPQRPPPPVGDYSQSGCALIIPGQGRSSAFDHAAGAFGNTYAPTPYSDSTCITYEAVNAALTSAIDRIGLPPGRGKHAELQNIANLGTVIAEASRYLAKQYGLSKDAIANGLPLIDSTKTVLGGYCPESLKTPKCQVERYRSISGACNNLEHPFWGAANVAHHLWIPPDYADGISAPRVSVTGQPLPTPRFVSHSVHTDDGYHDHAVTLALIAWGQFIDHDLTLTAETRDPATGKAPKCCSGTGPGPVHPECLPIEIPADDEFYRQHGQRCMNFIRSVPGLRSECALGPRVSFNEISSFLDAGTVYSNSPELFEKLRAFKGGLLKMLPVFDEFGMKELLPLKLDDPDAGCIRPSEDIYCFLAGDPRVNEQTLLATMHTLWVRNHNLVAKELALINPHWNDETLFQEARHINQAQMQHVNNNEFLPMVLGKEVMQRHNLILQKEGYYNGYDPSINPSVVTSFAAAAFRFGHTLLPSTIERWSKTHRYIGSQRLSEMLQQPYDLYKGGWFDNYIMGMINQVAQAYDNSITQEVTNHLFQEPGKKFGMDLASLNMQRGREFGVPSYNAWREFCGFKRIKNFHELYGIMGNQTVHGYQKYYSHPDDIDLWSAGVSEKPLPGSMVGPTFACIIGKQFSNLRSGDRFWYENGGWPSSFTLEQLAEIRKTKLSRVFCDNTDEIDSIQVYAMVLPDHEINPRVPCKSGVLPRIDFSKWRDASYHSSPGAAFNSRPF